jgi:hypothetical protein
VDWKDATIHVGSHIVHYGSGVFEGARCYDTLSGPACFRWTPYPTADGLGPDLPDGAAIRAAALTDAIFETITANGFRPATSGR